MVDFAGWDMPVQYSSIIEEHTAVRTAVGLFDISHMGRLFFTGPDALDLIQLVYTNNAATLKPGQVRYGLICNEQGGILDDVLVYRWPAGLSMVVNASNRAKIVAWLNQHRGQRSAGMEDITSASCMLAIQGPKAVDCCQGLTTADVAALPYYFGCETTYRGQPCGVSRTGYTGEDGFEFSIPASLAVELANELLARGARPCGLGARDTLRLEAGMPLYGHELNDQIDPFQAGLGWAVKMEKGEFIGREALERRRHEATRRQRIGLELDGKRIAREGAVVLLDGKEIGRVTSGTFSPTLEKAIAMAYVDPAHTGAGTACEVDVRGKPAAARVAPLPFYRRQK
jgi:aminomethyltransferase